MRIISIAVLAAALSAGQALAASPMGQLKDVGGTVYVNRGTGFVQVEGPTELFQGDRVLVGENSSAAISYYLAQCDVMLAATSVTTISANAPCQAASEPISQQGLTMEREGVLIVGGVAVAAGVGGVLILTSGDDDDNNDNGQSP